MKSHPLFLSLFHMEHFVFIQGVEWCGRYFLDDFMGSLPAFTRPFFSCTGSLPMFTQRRLQSVNVLTQLGHVLPFSILGAGGHRSVSVRPQIAALPQASQALP